MAPHEDAYDWGKGECPVCHCGCPRMAQHVALHVEDAIALLQKATAWYQWAAGGE